MSFKMAIGIPLAAMFALTSVTSHAGGGQHGPGADRMQGVDRDRSRQVDRERMFDRDRVHERDRGGIPEQDRYRLQDRDPSRMRDEDIYGHELMTSEERKQYRDSLGEIDTIESRMAFQAQHEHTMQKRALETGEDLVPPGQRPVYGGDYMTAQERNRYREQLRWLETDKERERFMAKHQRRMDKRARALGHTIEEPR
jgi:hypothetical protein